MARWPQLELRAAPKQTNANQLESWTAALTGDRACWLCCRYEDRMYGKIRARVHFFEVGDHVVRLSSPSPQLAALETFPCSSKQLKYEP